MEGGGHTDLILDEPTGQLLRRPIALPLETSHEDSFVAGLHVQWPVHRLFLARILPLGRGGGPWGSCTLDLEGLIVHGAIIFWGRHGRVCSIDVFATTWAAVSVERYVGRNMFDGGQQGDFASRAKDNE